MNIPPVIHWFRRDLRLSDNLALDAAAQTGAPVLPVFVFDPAIVTSRMSGAPRTAFLLRALAALDVALRARGSRLLVLHGDPRQALPRLADQTGAQGLYFNRDYSLLARRRDTDVEAALRIPVHAYDDALLLPPGAVLKPDNAPFTVFTHFKKRWLTLPKPALTTGVPAFFAADAPVFGLHPPPDDPLPGLADLGFAPTIAVPAASAAEAQRRLDDFVRARIFDYAAGRDRLAADPHDDTLGGSSFLSPYLRFGMLSPRQVYWRAHESAEQAAGPEARKSVEHYISELVWREFYMHILVHFPHVMRGSFRPAYDRLEWRHAPDELQAWKDGLTGYPVVDAAMRQLRELGWLPNRARMIVASFLTKDLLLDWREGEAWFMQHLIDGDPAANNGGWQWTAGTGTDAQPYFRIYNPVTQGLKFDPDGAYIRRWLPELRALPTETIHTPWQMATPPAGYPPPIVDHHFARERALAAFSRVEKKPTNGLPG